MRFSLILLTLVAAGSLSSAFGQGRSPDKTIAPSVIVTLGKPNVWTMEQAHYLLEKNRAHDLGIATADLGALDANEIVGYRLEAIKSLLAAQVQYDATVGKKNNATVSQYNTDMAQYNLLRDQFDELRTRHTPFPEHLAHAKAKLTPLHNEKPRPKEIATQNAEVTRITQEQAAANAEATSLSQALGTEPTLSNLTSSVPNSDETTQSAIGTNSTFTTMLSGVPSGLNNSKVGASIKLDNYIHLNETALQYLC
jgi:cell division protein FtsB